MTISQGANVSNADGRIGWDVNADGEVTVTGSDSSWECNASLLVGASGTGTMSIRDGGRVTGTWARIGHYGGAAGIVEVTGANSHWNCTDSLIVGNAGTGDLAISDSGAVDSSSATIGESDGSHGEVHVIDGGWTLADSLVVGHYGHGTLTINNGSVSATWCRVAWNAGSTGILSVAGPAGQLNLSQNLEIGEGGVGSMTVSGGASVSSTSSHIGNAGTSRGSVTVTGEGSIWTLTGSLEVGSGATGDVEILDGGVVDCLSDVIVHTSSVGAASVLVDGAESRFIATNGLTVGQASGGSGMVTLAHGAELHAATTIRANGRLDGAGTVVGDVSNEGMLAPGDVGGVLVVTGNVTQTGAGVFLATIDGPNSTGALAATGTVVLQGELQIQLAEGYNPDPGQVIEVITASSVTGQFDSITQSPGTLVNVIYESDRVLLEVFPAPDALRIEPDPAEVRVGFPKHLHAIATAAGVDFDVTGEAAWASDASTIASIEAPGQVRGEAVGQTTVTSTYDVLVADAAVEVRPLPAKLKTEMISVTPSGEPGNGESWDYRTAVSGDGRHVAFVSRAADLVVPTTNGELNVFVRDLATGHTHRVSIAFDGSDPDGPSDDPSLSANGRFVCFSSYASNLLAPNEDNNATHDVFVGDRDADGNGVFDEPDTLVITRVSVGTGSVEAPAGGAYGDISTDGRYVVFQTNSPLSPSDSGDLSDLYVHDRESVATTWISQNAAGQAANDGSHGPSISADGRFVAFHSDATDLGPADANLFGDVYWLDRDADENGVFDEPGTRVIERVSVSHDGGETDGSSYTASISDAGDVVTFLSYATNLVAGDSIDNFRDVYVWAHVTDQITRVNRTPDGEYSTGDNVGSLNLCPNGRFVGFRSAAEDMCGADGAAIGGYTFRYDFWTGRTETMSLSPFGDAPNGISGWIAFSYDGRVISFVSDADNLTPWDLNGVGDAFVRYDWSGDHDNDGDVDSADFAAFVDCLSGPGNVAPVGCGFFDRDADGDVDLSEFAEIQRDYTGAAP